MSLWDGRVATAVRVRAPPEHREEPLVPDMTDNQVRADLLAREPLSHREPRDAGRDRFEALFAPDLVWIGASGRRATRE